MTEIIPGFPFLVMQKTCNGLLPLGIFQIADDMVPPWILTQILIGVSKFFPRQKLVPQGDLAEAAFREPKKREQVCCFLLVTQRVTHVSVIKRSHC